MPDLSSDTRTETMFVVDLPVGTPVLTLEGEMPVEHLLPEDRIITRAGSVLLTDIASDEVVAPDLLRVSARALGHDRPDEDMLLPAGQPILIRDWRARALFGAMQATVPLKRLVDGQYIRPEPVERIRMIRLTLPRASVIYAGTLEVATLAIPVAQTA
ncbi:Hint domain-containing protein [Tabrizicola sp. J26]|uniref:Hint domain-containing protein n=1 Tax=Alitabrizicola rongguiensis TaxID=2909234 RepID=UPI001F298CA3|nr:Hint domain-containing protein [Tabrizicola rongguiensis]MCF1709669.1 Hint domain-containing protein [Tabrizicola rongguiensis]